jgi:hypothetical protein
LNVRPFLVAFACVASAAHAATFVVTTTNDDGAGSLRQAILDSNAHLDPDDDFIEFAIDTGVQTIQPATELPAVTKAVTMDGTTQPGYAGTPLIVIDGVNVAAGLSGLILSNHTGSTVKALVINRFAVDFQTGGNGLLIQGGGGHTIVGSYFGTDAAGTTARPNGRYGIACNGCSSCTIGGTDPADRNLLSGNTAAGLLLRDAASNVVQGNWIGLDASGAAALGNAGNGIFMLTGSAGTPNNLIGGDTASAGNVISGNGIGMTIGNSQTSGTVVKHNLIGTDASGTVVVGNTQYGIHINSSPTTTIDGNVIVGNGIVGVDVVNAGSDGTVITGNAIGTDEAGVEAMPNGIGIRVSYSASGAPVGTKIGGAGVGNVIAHNGNAGVVVLSGLASNQGMVVSPTGVDVRENRIFANGGLAIDLEADGITPNDFHDEDDGANRLQNFPTVTGTVDMGDTIEFHGTLDAAPSTAYRVELYECAAADPSGNGEADSPLGTAMVMTDEDGHVDFVAPLSVSITPGAFITATATDAEGNTSELSPVFPIPGGATTSSTSTSSSTSTATSSSSSLASTTSTASTSSATSSTAVGGTTTTSSSSSTVVPTTATTSTSSTTTTTTAPGCPQEPFAFLACNVARVQDAVDSAIGLDPIRSKLATRIGSAATNVEDARAACGARKTARTRRGLGKVGRALGQCAKTLRSKKARTVPDGIRTALGGLIASVQSDVTIVKSGLTCP